MTATDCDLLLARIVEREERATVKDDYANPRVFPFFTWLDSDTPDRSYGRNAGHLGDHELELIQAAGPKAVLADCARDRQIVRDCTAALTYRSAPGMEGAAVLAERVLQQLDAKYSATP
ncbi:hypothetical protein SAMN05660748_4506 [Blastococcus aggregatus]|uniref:Uncharacterized protein n=1 Tax=Blastococcus aggregatus TaxID=38502 RepID=A0A285VHN9_9ACTN|nr:hypothetical protein [Blastococcus aggregatus]SOC53589.1 hypothetical protein SAMN05660748_4506 [Blastococcus aggregatus]